MNLYELNQIVREGESDRVEFKKTTSQRVEGMLKIAELLAAASLPLT